MDGEGAGLTCHTAPVRDVERVVDSCADASAGCCVVFPRLDFSFNDSDRENGVSLKTLCTTFFFCGAVTD